MKVAWFPVLILVASVLSLLPQATARAATVPALADEASMARQAGQAWVDKVARTRPELAWKGASVTAARPCRGLDDTVNAYLFEILGSKGVVGRILVGSSSYGFHIFDAVAGSFPVTPTPREVKAASEKVGINVMETEIRGPDKMLFLGIDGLYAVYRIGNRDIAVNLVFKTASMIPDLKSRLPSPEQYASSNKAIKQSKPATMTSSASGDYLLSGMYVYSDVATGRTACGPDSGVSIAQYYRDRQGYDNIRTANDGNPPGPTPPPPNYLSNAALYDRLFVLMQTTQGATWVPTSRRFVASDIIVGKLRWPLRIRQN